MAPETHQFFSFVSTQWRSVHRLFEDPVSAGSPKSAEQKSADSPHHCHHHSSNMLIQNMAQDKGYIKTGIVREFLLVPETLLPRGRQKNGKVVLIMAPEKILAPKIDIGLCLLSMTVLPQEGQEETPAQCTWHPDIHLHSIYLYSDTMEDGGAATVLPLDVS
ncbi:hypothetical protein JZ751_018318 [Albula glossodonta]|uniref:Uncharacterized protein n=1 Tax=Albula glossodonta TaxID=121402 RepID=A0A8T2NS59_9TELE|nr:hypothetical protein JZ751_018318 [Albula glossodonta]